MAPALAVDIGGSGVRAASVAPDGGHEAPARRPLTAGMSRPELLRAIRMTMDQAGGADPCGIAVPGFIDAEGRLCHVVNLPALEGLVLDEAFPGAQVVPDLAAAAVAESRLGAGRDRERVLVAALGTGANAALVVDDRVVKTAFGCLGDAGHVVVDPDGPPCSCGGVGCLEALASGPALARAGQAIGVGAAGLVVAAARTGDPQARAIVERAGTALGRAIVSWSVMTFPDVVVVGGGVADAGELLLAPARREVARLGAPYVVEGLEIVPAALGRDATLVGAGLVALERSGAPT
jgi:glucokinase